MISRISPHFVLTNLVSYYIIKSGSHACDGALLRQTGFYFTCHLKAGKPQGSSCRFFITVCRHVHPEWKWSCFLNDISGFGSCGPLSQIMNPFVI